MLTREMFEDVLFFTVAEPGAMGAAGTMEFWRKNGETFWVNYLSGDTDYEKLKELFPVLKDCYWNGPRRCEHAAAETIVIGAEPDDQETHVAPGWKHYYLDFGNHLAIREELYLEMKDIFYDKLTKEEKSYTDIALYWEEYLQEAGFVERADEIMEKYRRQKKADAELAEKLKIANQNPEYREKVKAASGDMDAMMAVLKEYTGIEMSWFELKQFGFRQSGLL